MKKTAEHELGHRWKRIPMQQVKPKKQVYINYIRTSTQGSDEGNNVLKKMTQRL